MARGKGKEIKKPKKVKEKEIAGKVEKQKESK